MAISPKELVLTETELTQAGILEDQIDTEIKRMFTKSEVEILLKIGRVSERVRNEVIRRYKNAGWSRVNLIGYDQFVFRV